VLVLSGSFDQLTNLAVFAFWLFYGMITASVFIFRRRFPEEARPYRTLGYPVVPALFVAVTIGLIVFTLYNAPLMSAIGLMIIVLGLPIYLYFWLSNRPRVA
jgi:APA family basic amino acid/polyamine antiporter